MPEILLSLIVTKADPQYSTFPGWSFGIIIAAVSDAAKQGLPLEIYLMLFNYNDEICLDN